MKLSFYGASQQISGSCFLLETKDTKILLDCGLFQCPRICEEKNHEPFPFDPKTIDAVILTHAHIDHSGRIPKLFKEGYSGPVYSTSPTKDIARLMLEDSLGLMRREVEQEGGEMLFGKKDYDAAFSLWEGVEYYDPFTVGDFQIRLLNAGHIMGSAMIEIVGEENGKEKKIVYTGDLGNPPTPLLPDTDAVTDADVLIIETTYGDRKHEGRDERRIKLERVFEDTIQQGGTLMIPSFSLERSQELLYELNNLIENGRVPSVPVFLDSPLAIKATEVYRKYKTHFNQRTRDIIQSGDKIFKFPMLKFTLETKESKAINDVSPPKVIIAGSGMSTGGRIIHHEKRYLPDKNSTLLLVGYQAAGSRGRELQDGAKNIKIFGHNVPVRARVERISGYSAHPDRDMLLEFVQNSRDSLQRVFAVHGEPDSTLFFVQRVRDYLGLYADAPSFGETVEI